ncbi:GNAT family N-acetyltransferase [Zobellella aerophila]|uniref:GNAT family N-acetyltransferase n=1 Tax=Zobellella aerophila TaxID=870480 RepID=A0ABP6V370_9GAMM
MMLITAITDAAWPQIMHIQSESYQDVVPESEAVLRSKWHASPATSLQCVNGQGRVLGYLLSHPWPHQTLPALHREYQIDGPCSSLYLHDLAVSQHAHGMGVGQRLVEALLHRARAAGLERIELVSVQGSEGFWTRFGFNPRPQAELCSSYGEARAMRLNL